MAAPPITERHKPHFHRQAPIKESVRAATTAAVTIATALNNGDSLDGLTLATGDRVLVKDQSSPAENGVYVVGTSPVRDYDVSTDDPAFGYLVFVREGTLNGGTLWKNTNTAAPTIGSTGLAFALATSTGAATITSKDEGSTLSSTVTTIDFVGAGVTASGAGATTTITIPGGSSTPGSAVYPLDGYALDGTYGDHFTAGSLSGSWTRRNFTSGAETYAAGKNATYLHLVTQSRSVGDGYFRTAPGGDWTFAMKAIYRIGAAGFGPAVVDTAGTGAGFLPMYATATPNSPLLVGITTYSTYGGTYYQPISGSGGSASPNATVFGTQPLDRAIWSYLRKSGTSYYGAFSLDGEIWSPEAGPITWAGTVDRVGMMLLPLSGGVSNVTSIEIDWWNKIA